MTTHPLTVLTLNLANYDDHLQWDERVQMMADTIIANKPDFILLQEARFNPDEPSTKRTYQDMSQQVLYALQTRREYEGATLITVPVANYPFNSYTVPVPSSIAPDGRYHEWEGKSIISTKFVTETGTAFLSSPGEERQDLNPRATTYICVDLQNGQGSPDLFYLFTTHFAYINSDAVGNAKATVKYMERIVDVKTDRFILTGDLNSIPGSDPVKILDTCGFMTDVWVATHGNQDPGFTFPSTNPIKRIDYIYASNTILKKVTNVVRVGTTPSANGTYLSDHFGVLATFNIPVPDAVTNVENELERSFFFV
eukprot:TRINITY_DN4973_c0_g1_i2.p1 TRINITY_DN4973_c0_g1~~TRINITY_DN4973_c0_g1_i2.p1  ORF type:complete len:311 (+),score=53.12 TRINITY_DN4973_c0_g1_i2:2-934(+)